MGNDHLGKDAEGKIQDWLAPLPEYSFFRIKDQMTGFYGSSNPCDFIVYRMPNMCYLEAKATWKDRFDFSNITDVQRTELVRRSKVKGVYGVFSVLFASYQRTFFFDANSMFKEGDDGDVVLRDDSVKSLNIKKIDKWPIPYVEVGTIPNNRKKHLDYTGDFMGYLESLEALRMEGADAS